MKAPDLHHDLEHLLGAILQDFMEFLHHTGLSGPQIHALLHIYHSGECQVSEIGVLSGASAAAASQLVERLVQQGLVQRSEDPLNRRIKRLHLTGKGLKLIHQGVSSNHTLTGLMAALPAQQRQVVHTALGYLAQASRKTHSPSPRKAEQHA